MVLVMQEHIHKLIKKTTVLGQLVANIIKSIGSFSMY